MKVLFDDASFDMVNLFQSEVRTLGTYAAIALLLLGVADRMESSARLWVRAAALFLLLVIAAFGFLSDRQYTTFISGVDDRRIRQNLSQWRFVIPSFLLVLLIAAVASFFA